MSTGPAIPRPMPPLTIPAMDTRRAFGGDTWLHVSDEPRVVAIMSGEPKAVYRRIVGTVRVGGAR